MNRLLTPVPMLVDMAHPPPRCRLLTYLPSWPESLLVKRHNSCLRPEDIKTLTEGEAAAQKL